MSLIILPIPIVKNAYLWRSVGSEVLGVMVIGQNSNFSIKTKTWLRKYNFTGKRLAQTLSNFIHRWAMKVESQNRFISERFHLFVIYNLQVSSTRDLNNSYHIQALWCHRSKLHIFHYKSKKVRNMRVYYGRHISSPLLAFIWHHDLWPYVALKGQNHFTVITSSKMV